jgi:hypothetical protein
MGTGTVQQNVAKQFLNFARFQTFDHLIRTARAKLSKEFNSELRHGICPSYEPRTEMGVWGLGFNRKSRKNEIVLNFCSVFSG